MQNLYFQKEEFDKLDDTTLIKMTKAGNKNALNYLLNKYTDIVNMKANKYFMIGAEKEDIMQEGLIGLFKAIKSFDPEKQSSFKTFANLCVERQLQTAIKTSTRQKHMPLNSYLSLNISAYDENDDTSSTDDRNDEDTSMTGANGTFNEMLRRVLYIAAFSILVLLGVGIIWLILIAWYRRVKVYNDKNTDDYEEENYEVVYKGYIKKEDKGIYYITIPEKIIEERTTDRFQIKLKELFARRHNGDMLMVEIEGTKLSYSFEIDEKENMVKFTYADFVIEE